MSIVEYEELLKLIRRTGCLILILIPRSEDNSYGSIYDYVWSKETTILHRIHSQLNHTTSDWMAIKSQIKIQTAATTTRFYSCLADLSRARPCDNTIYSSTPAIHRWAAPQSPPYYTCMYIYICRLLRVHSTAEWMYNDVETSSWWWMVASD